MASDLRELPFEESEAWPSRECTPRDTCAPHGIYYDFSAASTTPEPVANPSHDPIADAVRFLLAHSHAALTPKPFEECLPKRLDDVYRGASREELVEKAMERHKEAVRTGQRQETIADTDLAQHPDKVQNEIDTLEALRLRRGFLDPDELRLSKLPGEVAVPSEQRLQTRFYCGYDGSGCRSCVIDSAGCKGKAWYSYAGDRNKHERTVHGGVWMGARPYEPPPSPPAQV